MNVENALEFVKASFVLKFLLKIGGIFYCLYVIVYWFDFLGMSELNLHLDVKGMYG